MSDGITSASAPDLTGDVLTRNLAEFAAPRGRDLLGRTAGFMEWADARRTAGLWPYNRSLDSPPGPEARTFDEEGRALPGRNFGSQDYLSLGPHPAVRAALLRALDDFGPHSASSGILQGNTRLSRDLERRLAEFLELENVMLFPTGWAAGFGSISGLVRQYDYIVLDKLAHACLQAGAYSATSRVLRNEHNDVGSVRARLEEIRRDDADAAVLVVTEGLFSLDSDSPSIEVLQEACSEFEATLMVDVAHDLGALGPAGTGRIGIEGMLGKVDLVMGSFSKTFASNGGFLASNRRSAIDFVRAFGNTGTFSNALSPTQAAVVTAALEIVRSPEGDRLREDLMRAVHAIRDAFSKCEIECLGAPSAIVIVPVGDEAVARVAGRLLVGRGVLVNVFEFPAVSIGSARFRLQMMAAHTEADVRDAASVVSQAVRDARSTLDRGSGDARS